MTLLGPRLAVHQLRRREDLPRGGRVGPQGATRRCSTRSSSAWPTSGGASGSPPSCRPRPDEAPTLDELVEHCRTKIAGYKVPRELHLVDEMPRHPSGKPDYRRAKAVAEEGTGMKNRLTEMFGIEFPIFAFSHCRDVVAAVTNAGGMGVLGALAFSPEQLELELKWIDEHVDGKPYGVDVVMPVKTVDRELGLGSDAKDLGAKLREMIDQEHWDYVDKILADHGVDPSAPDDADAPMAGRHGVRRRARVDRGHRARRRSTSRWRTRSRCWPARSARRRRRPSTRPTSRA